MSRPKSRAKSRPNEARVSVAVPPRTLWGSLAAGAVIWSLHLIVSYALVSLACERGLLQAIVGGFALVRWLALGLTLLAAAAVLYATLVAYRQWRQMEQTRTAHEDETSGRVRFMLLLAALLNGTFLLAIVVSFFPALFLPLCD